MKAPEGATGCSHAGEAYDVDDAGHVTVPDAAVVDLKSHGYEPVADVAQETDEEVDARIKAENAAQAEADAAAAASKKGGKK